MASTAGAKPALRPVHPAKLAKAEAATSRRLGDAFRAYDAGDVDSAEHELAKLGDARLANTDYALWLRGMVALRGGDAATARTAFTKLATMPGSRFAPQVAWRLADVAWLRGDRAAAAAQYTRLLAVANAEDAGDLGTAMFRIAEVKHTAAAYRALVIAHPSHPLAAEAEAKMLELGGAPLGPADRVERAKQLTAAHLWDQAIQELALVPREGIPEAIADQRDYWTGTTLYEMRRRYGDAGRLLLGVYAKLGASAAEAMFHGARALSRADHDDEAIAWYHKVVAAYPNTAYAREAQFLSGWLEFNRGHYQAAIAPLEDSLARYPHSKWADDSLWFLAMSHYFLNQWDQARTHLATLAKRHGALEAGKGSYWLARIDQRLAHQDAAIAGYRATITKFPFSWYALLSRSRLAALGVAIGPFGDGDAKPRGPKLAATVDEALASDALIARADELIAAGLGVDAGQELARGERAFLHRHDRAAAFAMLLDRYRKAGNYNRPWMLAVSYSGSALDGPPEDDARRWWENAYPRAYRDLVEKYQALGDNPEGYLYSIMRKESGFDPHDLSYADAQGLLQMIPPTTQRVAKALGIPYDAGKLYEPAFNIETGSWYIGHLLAKFKTQIPLGAGSFNSGPRPVMKWIDTNGDREIDELVELVPYTQTREYMKKVTENYARYRYLYGHELYEQPLAVDKQHYIVDQLTY
ncbi:MAG: transglycosylase SLT domain-containing protein [Kofleriaceae bacterium]